MSRDLQNSIEKVTFFSYTRHNPAMIGQSMLKTIILRYKMILAKEIERSERNTEMTLAYQFHLFNQDVVHGWLKN